MFYTILDDKRKKILPLLIDLKDEFYLAGGTALALQIGHRDSVDFDFFSQQDFNTATLFGKLEKIFAEYKILKIQEERNTLTIFIDDEIKLSFFTYKYKLLNPLVTEKYIKIASIEDIACMKLSAIVSRATWKDYVDLYYILQKWKLPYLLALTKKKFPAISSSLILKSLIYFDDVVEEDILFINNKKISFSKIKTFLLKLIKEIEG